MDIISTLFDYFSRIFNGKRIVILGAKATGKTTLHTFIRTGKLITEYEETLLEKVPANTYHNGKFKLHIKKGDDVGGSKALVSHWDKLMSKSDVCIFLFNTEDMYNNDAATKSYLEDYLPLASELARTYNSNLIVIGNFSDKIPDFNINNKQFANVLRPNLINAMEDAHYLLNDVIYGSMDNLSSIEELVKQIITKNKIQNM